MADTLSSTIQNTINPSDSGSDLYIKQSMEAAESIRSLCTTEPVVGLVLGSGYAPFMEKISENTRIEYKDLQGFKSTGVSGHASYLKIGKINNTQIICFGGRKHLYEGEGIKPVIYPALLCYQLGVKHLILTNAAGGVNPGFNVGDLMIVTDHIDSTFHRFTKEIPVILDSLNGKEPKMPVYDHKIVENLLEVAESEKIPVHKGTYALMLGPFYETEMEIKVLGSWGADAVGMSTIPEAMAAWHLGMKVTAISGITNMATGLAKKAHSHSEVTSQAKTLLPRLVNLLESYFRIYGKVM